MFARSFTALGLVVALAGFSAGCSDSDTAELFGADLAAPDGITSTATGTATFTVLDDQTVSYTITVNGIEDANAAHIHQGFAGQTGAVVIGLFAGTFSGSGELVSGTFDATDVVGISFDELVGAMRGGSVYVNVHTDANPDGEIRGQITRN